MTITLTVNGQVRELDVEPDTPLLWALRDTLGLTGTKFGCGISACGACTVHLNGRPVRSCSLPVSAADGGPPSPRSRAWPGAARSTRCSRRGWPTRCRSAATASPGMIMAVAALLDEHPHPTDEEIDAAITNICRCGTFARVRTRHPHRGRQPGRRVMGKWTRRAFIGAGTVVGGGFVLGVAGFTFAPSRHTPRRSDDAEATGELNTWILVTPGQLVTVLVPHCEMGQGAQTALAMMAAEEMDADWAPGPREGSARPRRVRQRLRRPRVRPATRFPAALGSRLRLLRSYRLARGLGFQVTGGSTVGAHHRHYGMRVAGAAAKEMLVAAAAAQFGVPASECEVAKLARDPCRVGPHPPRSVSWRRRRRTQSVPSQPGAEESRQLTRIRRTPRQRLDMRVEGGWQRHVRHRLHAAGHAATPPSRWRRCTAASSCRWTPRPPRRCPA